MKHRSFVPSSARYAMLGLSFPMAISAATAQTPDPVAALVPVDGKRVALVIGNSDYQVGESWKDLPNAANDARYIAKTLSDPERGDARFEVDLLIDGNSTTIRSELAKFAEKAKQAKIAVVYYAGHGFEFNGENFIVPVDAPGFVSQNRLANQNINMTEVVNSAEPLDGISIFFLDACRTPGDVMRQSADTSGNRAALFGAIESPRSSAVFYATIKGESAYDAAPEDAPLSPFATAVGNGISTPGLDLPYVFYRVRDDVQRATSIYNPTQNPLLMGGWSRPFYFIPPQGGNPGRAQTAAVLPSAPVATSANPDRSPPQTRGTGLTPHLDISLDTLSTVDEPLLLVRVLQTHSVDQILALANDGDPIALYLAGFMKEYGVGVTRDLNESREWLERAAATGHPAGLLELGYFLRVNGTAEDRPRALSLYRKSSDMGYAKAKSHLATALLDGTLGGRNSDEAYQLYRDAARLGHPYAHYALTVLGEEPKTHIAALETLAKNGNNDGNNWLCQIDNPAIGQADHFAHCLKAARAGHPVPAAKLALLYASGQGVPASRSDARYWARIALAAYELPSNWRNNIAGLAEIEVPSSR